MIQPIEAAKRLRAVAESTDLPMSAMLEDVARLLDQVDFSDQHYKARIAELEAELAEARAKYVREGIERVRREQPHYTQEMPDVWEACNRARAAFDAEQGGDDA